MSSNVALVWVWDGTCAIFLVYDSPKAGHVTRVAPDRGFLLDIIDIFNDYTPVEPRNAHYFARNMQSCIIKVRWHQANK